MSDPINDTIDISSYSPSPSPSLASEDSYHPSTSPHTPNTIKKENIKKLLPLPSPSPSPHKDKKRRIHPDSESNEDDDIVVDAKPKVKDEDVYPVEKKKRGRPAGKGNSNSLKEKGRGGSVNANGSGGGGGSRKTGSWTKREVRQLWEAMGFLPVKVRWDDVADKVDGRDKLSCSNKWRYDMLPKIESFINGLGDEQ